MRRLMLATVLSLLALPVAAQSLPTPDRYNGDRNSLPVLLKTQAGTWCNFALTEKLRSEKDDTRTDVRQIGVRPALVVLLQVPPGDKGASDSAKKAMTNCLAALRAVEAIAVRHPEFETWVLLANRDVVPTPDAIKSAGVKNVVVAVADMGYSLCEHVPGLRFCYMEHETNARYVAKVGDKEVQYYYEWIWMPRPATVTFTGDEFDDETFTRLGKEAKAELAPILKERKAEQFLKAASLGNFKAAGKLIGELRGTDKSGKPAASDELLEMLNTLVLDMEAILRDTSVTDKVKNYFYAEAAEALEGIVELNKGREHADVVAKELAEIKAKPEYKACVEARPVFEKLKKRWLAVVPDHKYGESVRDHYDKIVKAYGPLKAEIEAFQKKYKGVGYQAEVGQWAAKLNDAESRLKKAIEEGK